MKKLLSVMLLALLLTGCGGEEKTTTICKGNIDEMTAAEVTIEATGEKIILKIELDYGEADFDELKKAKLVTTTDSDKKIVYISLEETIKEQEKGGLTCKEK